MKTRNSILFGITVLFAFLLLGFTSATITFTNVPTLSRSLSSANLTIQSDFNETVSFSGLNTITNDGSTITFSKQGNITLVAGVSKIVTVNYIISPSFLFELGQTYSTILSANGTNSSQVSTTLSFPQVNDFCSNGDQGDLELSVEIDNTEGYGEEDTEWYPLDEVEFEITVENNGDETIKNIIVEWGLYNPSTGDWIIDDEEADFDLKKGKEKVITIIPKINPDDYDSNTEEYIFYVKAYEEDNESAECADSSDEITVFMDSDFVIVSNPEVIGELTCGGEIQITADVWNIGTDDQEDVYVTIYNKELSINEKVIIGDIDSLDKEELEATIKLPSTITSSKKYFSLEFEVYDNDDDLYENDNEDESVSNLLINLSACSAQESGKAQISASLDSDVVAGKDAKVLIKITNLASKLATYSLVATGYSNWASSAEFEKSTISLESGKAIEVPLTINIKEGISGAQTFRVQILEGNNLVLDQEVEVDVEANSSKNFFSGIFGDNWYLWLIGILNVILVIVIIIIAIKVAKS